MKYYLIVALFTGTLHAYGQDTTYFDLYSKKVTSLAMASYYEVVSRDLTDTNKVLVKSYYSTGTPRSEENYSNYGKKKREGKWKEWYTNGQLQREIDYKNDKMSGQLLTYWDNGKPKRKDRYENGKYVSGSCMTSAGTDTVHYDYIIYPHFPGGDKKMINHLSKQMKYPSKSKAAKIQGGVLVGFVVNEDGSISNATVTKSVAEDLDKEAIRVIQTMPNWIPGMQDGIPIRVQTQLTINFKLNDSQQPTKK